MVHGDNVSVGASLYHGTLLKKGNSMKFKNESFLVFGMQKSGFNSALSLLKLGAKVYIYDDDNSVYDTAYCKTVIEKGGKIAHCIDKFKENYEERNFACDFDVVVVSPGVKADNDLLVKLKRCNKRIIGELELGYLLSAAPIIAVSGTNGKTTVCTILHKVLTEAGETCFLGGNVGTPFCEFALSVLPQDVCVLEVSSFQLETVSSFTPHIAVMLNLSEDHLDRHYTMENYCYLKKRLFKNLRESEWAVLNYDDQTVRNFAKDLKCKVAWFSAKEKVFGAYLSDGAIYYNEEEVLKVSGLSLIGEHNVENALACVCALKIYGVKSQVIKKSLSDFNGVKYRLEKVGVFDGVTYYNDSKSTNVASALKAVDVMETPTVIILGGKDKNQDFTPIFNSLKNCKDKIIHAVLMGECRFKLLECAQNCGYTQVTVSPSFSDALKVSRALAVRGGAVLFSPGAASFDMFKDYAKRGEKFNAVINKLCTEGSIGEPETESETETETSAQTVINAAAPIKEDSARPCLAEYKNLLAVDDE